VATIIRKRKGHRVYYYAVEVRRVNGQPRIVWQKYLGKLEDIVRRKEDPTPKPITAKLFDFGAIAALWTIAQRLRLAEWVDAHTPKRDQGPTVGEYLLVAALNRAVAPTSKAKMGEWFEGTVLRRLMPHIRARQLSSRRFWDHMDRLDAETLRAIERDLSAHMVREFALDLRTLVYDTTNFVTYIDSATDSEIPQRGASKAKRFDLKQVGLALLVTLDFHVPLFHEAYPGHRPDSREFESVLDELTERYRMLARQCEEITLVLDKGNNARANYQNLKGYHVVGSLVPSQHPDLLAIPKSAFRPLQGRWAGHLAYRTIKTLFGRPYTVLVVYHETLFLGQLQGMTTKLKKATQALREISTRLENYRRHRRGQPPTLAGVECQVQRILKGESLKELIQIDLRLEDDVPALQFAIDHAALQALAERRFGKTLLFTDQASWTDEQILAAYRGQAQMERAIRQMKDPHFESLRPMFHWTDSKIRVHAFYCVMALALSALLLREVHRRAQAQGIDPPVASIPDLLSTLQEIHELVHLYPPTSKIPGHLTLSDMKPRQRLLFELLELGALAP